MLSFLHSHPSLPPCHPITSPFLPSSLFSLALNSIVTSKPFRSYLRKGAAMPTD